MWSPVVHSTLNENRSVPKTRSKHASCIVPDRRTVYLLGGRCSTIPLRDFWTFDLDTGLWTSLLARGTPVNVQEHSMIYWNDRLYVFGGVFAQAGECPFWLYHIQTSVWEEWQCPRGQNAPQSRKAHTAVTYGNAMYIYGGYQDMRGSLSELWQFSFEANQWKMLHGNEAKKSSELIPPPRHRHSSVVFDQGMWVYGGMTDLQDRSDFWRLDFVSKRWSAIKCKYNPGPLHSHSAVCVHSCMLIIGGEKSGNLSDEVWRFHFGTETWERLEIFEPKPSARTQLTAVTLSAPLFTEKRADPLRSSQQQQQQQLHQTDPVRMRTNGTCIKSSRQPLFNVVRKSAVGYQLVDTDEMDSSKATAGGPWLIKSSTYSLLSNTSTDSCAVDDYSDADQLPQMIQQHPGGGKKAALPQRSMRSESAYNFTSSAQVPPSSVPRSQTTARLNPFIRSETFDATTTTSDYASELGESSFAGSVVGIPNPVYDDEYAAIIDLPSNKDEEEEELNFHRSFAQALNNSLSNNNFRRRHNQLRNEVARLTTVKEPSPIPLLCNNSIVPLDEEQDLPSHDNEPIEDNFLSVLTFGGREAGHVTAFDRPLSIWMLRLYS